MSFSSENEKGFQKLPKEFYLRATVKVAKELIGKVIVRKLNRKVLSGIIVEAEAYLGENDPASHSFNGKTKRNEVMFMEGGNAYVYFTYGNHFCFCVVTEKENKGCAVLIRGVEPLEGIETMKSNRGTHDIFNLTNGPGKFTRAFGIGRELNGEDLRGERIFILNSNHDKSMKVLSSKRIGITRNTEKPFRFYLKDNPFVSRKKK
ncbi:MAG: DNA-3-methyladenine glycosylase [Ignavibacteria bacterium]